MHLTIKLSGDLPRRCRRKNKMKKAQTKLSDKQKVMVLTEAGYRCACPSCPNELTVDVHHIVEVHKGGGNSSENLLPLCPYCHSKYHRGMIRQSSIIDWKKRITLLYQSNHVEQVSPQTESDMMFATSFSKYSKRCYPIYYFYKYRGKTKYYRAGYATFIDERTLLTAKKVIEKIGTLNTEIPGGRASLLIGHECLDFTVKALNGWGDVVFLESEPLDNLRPPDQEVSAKYNLERTVPDTTEIKRIAGTPFIGQQLGYLFGADVGEKIYAMHDYAFAASIVSHFIRSNPPTVDRYAMTPCLSGICDLGGPAFTCSGLLTGIMIDAIPNLIQNSLQVGSIPVIGSFWGIDALKDRF